MPSPILLVTLHPDPASLSNALADAYAEGARASGHPVLRHDLATMVFDPDLGAGGYRGKKPLEPDLQSLRADMVAAGHWVLVAPIWWGGLPARAKGVFDRTLFPGFAFDPRKRRWGQPMPLLSGRTARVVLTSDSPDWYFRLVHRAALRRQIDGQILRFCGIKPIGFTHFSPVETSTDAQRMDWLAQMRALGVRRG
jgi:NAD(P)H dehydrogenase (quinone)